MSNILEQIVADKRIEIEQRKASCSVEELCRQCENAPDRPDFVSSLRRVPMGLIAEVKRKSPSAGMIREPFDPAAIAQGYQAHGANAISCLMDGKYFGGGAEDFAAVREAVALPMLYKEFVIDPWQVFHARVSGASAVLLIVGVLSDAELSGYICAIRELGLQPLVEVHDKEEMVRAIDSGADCIGINNRNLKTFETRIDTTFALAAMAPAGCTLVSESGIKTADDVLQLRRAGAHGILVGESLLREVDPGNAVDQLMAGVRVGDEA